MKSLAAVYMSLNSSHVLSLNGTSIKNVSVENETSLAPV